MAKSQGDDQSGANLRKQLRELTQIAAVEYSLKKYEEAAQTYASAAEAQAKLNGELAPENAELLYAYGKCLYKLAVSRNDVFGGNRQAELSDEPKKIDKASRIDEAHVAASANVATQGFFQFKGDENLEASDIDTDDDAEDNAEVDEVEHEDDFATAYEVLDLARVLFQRRVDEIMKSLDFGDSLDSGSYYDFSDWAHTQRRSQEEKHDGEIAANAADDEIESTANGVTSSTHADGSNGAPTQHAGDSSQRVELDQLRQLMMKLADTRDLQADISLETERFEESVVDNQATLDLRLKLYPIHKSFIAESHYKLALSLEFASLADAEKQPDGSKRVVKMDLREKAVEHLKLAIQSAKERVKFERMAARSRDNGDSKLSADQEREIEEVQDMIVDMEQRVQELSAPLEAEKKIREELSTMLGGTVSEQSKVKIEEAKAHATDLTSMVRKKKKDEPPTSSIPDDKTTNGASKVVIDRKRKAEDPEEDELAGGNTFEPFEKSRVKHARLEPTEHNEAPNEL